MIFNGFTLVFCPRPAEVNATSAPTATTDPSNQLPRCSSIEGLSSNRDRFTSDRYASSDKLRAEFELTFLFLLPAASVRYNVCVDAPLEGK